MSIYSQPSWSSYDKFGRGTGCFLRREERKPTEKKEMLPGQARMTDKVRKSSKTATQNPQT